MPPVSWPENLDLLQMTQNLLGLLAPLHLGAQVAVRGREVTGLAFETGISLFQLRLRRFENPRTFSHPVFECCQQVGVVLLPAMQLGCHVVEGTPELDNLRAASPEIAARRKIALPPLRRRLHQFGDRPGNEEAAAQPSHQQADREANADQDETEPRRVVHRGKGFRRR